MLAAHAYMRDPMQVDFGLLICDDEKVHYYAKLGWELVSEEIWIDQPQGRISFKAHTMVLPVWKTKWPAGEIDLRGRPW